MKNNLIKRNINRREFFLITGTLATTAVLYACPKPPDEEPPPDTPVPSEAFQTMQQLWLTTPFEMSAEREDALDKIQKYADNCLASFFKSYLTSINQSSESMERNNPVLTCYRMAFDRVLEGLKNDRVEEGTIVIWMLYNQGFVVKTASGSFGIDIYHRWAKEFAPYLDFMCVTHNHQDHYSVELIEAMFDANKPVLSNYLRSGSGYTFTSTTNRDYVIGKFTIKTAITDHNNTTAGRNFVTVFRIDCGSDSGNFTLLHVGDSNYNTTQYSNVEGAVNVLIPRYAPNALTENNILGTGSGQVSPDYVLLSHILELSHDGVEDSRWSINMALERASRINHERTYVPMWGEKMVWKNGKLE